MKKLFASLVAAAAFAIALTANAAPITPPTGGGTGTPIPPTCGSVLIGNASGTYTPGMLAAGTNVTIVTSTVAASSTCVITFGATGGSGGGSATTSILQALGPVFNFVSNNGKLTFSTSTSGGSSTVNFLLDLSSYLQAALTSLNGATSSAQTVVGGTAISVSTTPGAGNSTTTITNTGVTSFNNATGSVTGVGSFNAATGTINYHETTSGAGITSTVATSGGNSTTTFQNIGVTSLNSATGSITLQGSGSTTVSIVGTTVTINSTSSAGGLATAITSLNTATSSAQTIVATSTGIAVVTTPGASNSTTTIQNTGVVQLNGAGCVSTPNTTGTITLSVTCLSGNQTITFVISGDATGTASGATSINDSITVTGLNGKVLPANTSGTLQFYAGAWHLNWATSSLGLYDASGALSSFTGSTFSSSPSCLTSVTLSGAGALSGTSATCSGGSGSSTPQLPTIIVSSQTGATYPNNGTAIASATLAAANVSNFPNGALIWLPDQTYNVNATSSGGKLVSNVYVRGNGGTTINWPAPTKTSALFSVSSTITTAAQHCGVSDLNMINTSATFAGYAVDISNGNQCQYLNIQSFNFQYAQNANDTQNLTFQNLTQNWKSFDNGGLFSSSTNPVNDNVWIDFVTNPNQDQLASSGNKYYGVYMNHAQHDLFINYNCEPAVLSGVFSTSTVCMNLVNATSADPIYGITLDNPWFEGAATGTVIGAGVQQTLIIGGIMDTNGASGGASVQDAGTDTNILGLNDNFGTPKWQFGSAMQFNGALSASSTLTVQGTSTFQGQVKINSNNLVDASGNKYSTSTSSGSGSGNLFVSPTSTVLANNIVKYQTAGSSTVAQTSSIYSFADGNASVNTSTENGAINIVNSSGIPLIRASTSTLATSSPALNVLGASSTASSLFSVFQILGDGHVNSTGTLPVLSSCGTSPTITGTDFTGEVTVGSVSATGCTITFQIPFEATPSCFVTNESMSVVNAMTYTDSTSALTITQTGLTGAHIHYLCFLNT